LPTLRLSPTLTDTRTYTHKHAKRETNILRMLSIVWSITEQHSIMLTIKQQ